MRKMCDFMDLHDRVTSYFLHVGCLCREAGKRTASPTFKSAKFSVQTGPAKRGPVLLRLTDGLPPKKVKYGKGTASLQIQLGTVYRKSNNHQGLVGNMSIT